MQGIYRIRNKVDKKRYIGSTNDFEKGWKSRLKALRKGNYHNIHLQRAWNKYGEENFVFEIQEGVAGDNKALLVVEQIYLDEGFNLGILYNVARKAGGGNLGVEVNQKISERVGESWTPKRRRECSERNSGEGNPNYGKSPSKETRVKKSERNKEWWTPERRERWSEQMSGENNPRGMLGKHHTEDAKIIIKKKLEESWTPERREEHSKTIKEWWTPERRREQSKRYSGAGNPMYGKRRSEEFRARVAKPYPAFHNANTGEHILAGHDLAKLCRKRELSLSALSNLKLGNTKQSRDGWKLA